MKKEKYFIKMHEAVEHFIGQKIINTYVPVKIIGFLGKLYHVEIDKKNISNNKYVLSYIRGRSWRGINNQKVRMHINKNFLITKCKPIKIKDLIR